MKQLVLTSIANETSLETGGSFFVLMFNGGAFRLEITAEQAEQVIGYAFQDGVPGNGVGEQPLIETAPPQQDEFQDGDDGVPSL